VTVQAAITDASGEIDSYLAGRYALPIIDALPDMLRAGCMDLARYRLYDDHPPDVVKQRRADFVTWLNRVAAGHVQLLLSAAGVDALTSGMASTDPAADTDVPTFTRLVW
jgi:phage gp36-like protein